MQDSGTVMGARRVRRACGEGRLVQDGRAGLPASGRLNLRPRRHWLRGEDVLVEVPKAEVRRAAENM